MIDIRPVANTIGRLTAVFGAMMALPALVDWWAGDPHWQVFLESGLICGIAGALVALATRGSGARALALEQAFLLTAGVWLVLPLAGALPFVMGQPHASLTDAMFEAMSGVTTTGTTVFPELDGLPLGTHLWRAILQWSGGLGIVIVAMIFLPAMRIGGMQFFRSEGFDTLGKIMPRAGEIAAEMTRIYILITVACALTYAALGMTGYEAVVHALTTCSTGGFSNLDASFGAFIGPLELASCVFMILAAIPFIRMVQALYGDVVPLWRDSQIRAFLTVLATIILIIVLYRTLLLGQENLGDILRETTFNVVTIATGTGFASTDVTWWGYMPFALLIIAGLIGGCTGSTCCSIKVFRYQVLLRAVEAQIRRMQSPHRVAHPRLEGRRLDGEVVNSVMAFFTMFILSFGLLIVALALTGLHPRTALTAAWTAIANIGPVWGPEVTANGSVVEFPATAKWLMIAGMYVGRLELLAVYVLFLPRFWRQ
ncbi:TrkH family potassium uptake protein [uncultured Paracoccus sp.]|uniref:TrkH family potassium uptake protein n=1 Tax=uncultured Paracoccus sp. TaxID=189685 RepID=UPI0026312124|nr:TrkH family potassium uptake protein [uncultured Paracoccus sp.]